MQIPLGAIACAAFGILGGYSIAFADPSADDEISTPGDLPPPKDTVFVQSWIKDTNSKNNFVFRAFWMYSNFSPLDSPHGIKIFTGNSNRSLAKDIAEQLGLSLGKISVTHFADGEVNIMVNENVRGKDVYILQPTAPPVNETLMELLLMISTMRRASARKITAVIPYYGYARQDRKMQARVPISAADVARLLEAMGVDRVVAVDLHCGQIQARQSSICCAWLPSVVFKYIHFRILNCRVFSVLGSPWTISTEGRWESPISGTWTSSIL